MKKTAYIGIDPGMSKANPGCAALWVPETNYFSFCDWKDMDTAKKALITWQYQCYFRGIALEKVLSHPKNGHRQAFKFGENYGMWQGILCALNMRFELVTPQKWQRVIPPTLRGRPKDRSMKAVHKIFPGIVEFIHLKKHNGRADALLMAYYIKQLAEPERIQ